MNKTIELFDRALKKGSEMLFLHERLEDEEEVKRRLSVCRANAGLCYLNVRDKCIHCSCYMTSKTKMLKHKNPKAKGRIEVTHCPMAKWGKALSEAAYEAEKEIANYYRSIDKKPLIT